MRHLVVLLIIKMPKGQKIETGKLYGVVYKHFPVECPPSTTIEKVSSIDEMSAKGVCTGRQGHSALQVRFAESRRTHA